MAVVSTFQRRDATTAEMEAPAPKGLVFAPEVLVSFGPSFLVGISNAWLAHWGTKYSYEVEALQWFLEVNIRALRCQAEFAELMGDAFGSAPKWTYREIKRASDKNYVTLCAAEDLPEGARMCGSANDMRAKYPIPTHLFHTRMRAWCQLRAKVHIRASAKARHYHGAELPSDAQLPEGIDWDYVAWQHNCLPKRRP